MRFIFKLKKSAFNTLFVKNYKSFVNYVLIFPLHNLEIGLFLISGSKGDKGNTGLPGIGGLPGRPGNKGDTGEKGAQGLPGVF